MTGKSSADKTVECDLAIVGGGIAGPALAAALSERGYSIVLIERSADPLDTARGDALQPVSCESLERWGVLDKMFARGAERRCGARWLTHNGQLVFDVAVDQLDIPHPYFLYLNHELISEVFLEKAAENNNFRLLRPGSARVIRNPDSVDHHALLVNHADGQVKVNARCVVIADGRASLNRKALDIPARIHNYENPLLVLFAERTFDDPRNDAHIFLTSSGVISVVPRNGNQWKIGFPLSRERLGDWTDASPEELGRRLTQIVPVLDGIKPQVAGIYPVAMVNAERWVDGNCVLLGDACHALHPGRSQGMNVALRGVTILAKLLRDSAFEGGAGAVAALLREFETQHKTPIDARLEENHARGLEMDKVAAADVDRMRAALANVAASKEKAQTYCMRAAGY